MTPTVRRILLSQSLEKKVQSIVRRNGIAMYVPIPGVTCFQNSAGTIPAVVDDPVGYLEDTSDTRLCVYGADFSTVPANFAPNASNPALTVANNELIITVTANIDNGFLFSLTELTAGAQYVIEFNVRANRSLSLIYGGAVGIATSTMDMGEMSLTTTNKAYKFGFIPSSTSVTVNFRFAGGGDVVGDYFVISGFRVSQKTGKQAYQATSGYRPILRGKVKNLITYSNKLDNASWVKSNLTESASGAGWALATSTSNTEHVILQSFASNVITSYTIQCKIKANGYNGISVGFWGSAFNGLDNAYFLDSLVRAVQFDLLNGTIVQKPSYLSATITPLGSDEYLVSVTANNTTGTDIQARLYMKNTNANVTSHTFTGDGVSGVIIRDVQVNISDVLPYVATTSSPASSSYGPYWLDFDGVDDVLSISGLSAFTSAAVIKSVKNTGYSIQTEQDISAGYSFNTKFSNALMLAKSTPSSSELAVIKKYFDRLAGVA